MLWLLLTGEVPTPEQTRGLSAELAEKGELPDFVVKLVDSYVPPIMAFLTSFDPSIGSLRLSTQ